MITRRTKPEELGRVNELFSAAFEYTGEGPFADKDKGITHWASFDDEGEMLSTLAVTDFSIRFDGSECRMGGVGGVATMPQHRRKGGIRACFERALPELYVEGYDFSYLYPFSTAYYRKFGYESCVQTLRCSVDTTQLRPTGVGGFFRLVEKGGALTESIRQVDSAWESKYNMAVLHRDEDYEWVEKCDPFAEAEYTFVRFDPAGVPKAYVTFKTVTEPDGRNLHCSRFRFVDKEGFFGLMEVFRSVSADHRFAKFELPAETGMQYLLPEWSLGAASWTVKPAGMVRVVNAASVLKKAAYKGSGEVVLKLNDPQIAENNGCFRVRFENGRALCVTAVEDDADAELSISSFSALIAGVCSFREAAEWMPGLKVLNANAPLESVFYRKPLMIADYF